MATETQLRRVQSDVAGMKRYAAKVGEAFDNHKMPRNSQTAQAIDSITRAVSDLEEELRRALVGTTGPRRRT